MRREYDDPTGRVPYRKHLRRYPDVRVQYKSSKRCGVLNDMSEYDPDNPEGLPDFLEGSVNEYWNQYLDYWELHESQQEGGLSEETRAIHRGLDALGEATKKVLHSLTPNDDVRKAVQQLSDVAGIAPVDSNLAIKAFYSTHLVRDCVNIRLAFDATGSLLSKAQGRVGDLVAAIGSRDLSKNAADYLDRVTRLYLWGFDPECLVMCRSVIEAALTSRLYPELEKDESAPPLEELLRLAGEKEVLRGYRAANNKRGWSAKRSSPLWQADRFRWVGNKVLHDWATENLDTRDCI